MSQFRMLLWKDYYVHRGVLLTGAMILVAMLLVIPVLEAWDLRRHPGLSIAWRDVWSQGAFMSLLISQLTIAVLTGNAVAGERADRSVEFLAMLPASRVLVLAAKLVVTLCGAVAIWALNFPLLANAPQGSGTARFHDVEVFLLSTTVLLFGTGWLSSVLLRSSAIAAAIAIAAPLSLVVGLNIVSNLHGDREGFVSLWFSRIAPTLGLVQLALAIVVFLCRREP